MTMKKMLFLFAAALMMVACNKDNEPVVNNDNLINEITLAIEKSETRTEVTNDAEGLKFEWNENDIVYVFPAESGNTTNIAFEYIPETGKFTSGIASLTEGAKYFAVSGRSQTEDKFNQGGIKAAMNLSARPYLTNLPMVSDVFTATADGTFATLHHISSVVEIPITGTEGKQIYDIEFNVYNSTSDKTPIGDVDVTFDENGIINGIIKGTASNYSSMAQYTKSSPLTLSSTPQSIFIPILPGTYNNISIQYKVVDGNTESTIMREDEFTFVRGKLHKKSSAVNIVIEEE